VHYRVDAKAMEDAMAVLSELPYRHVHKVIEAVQAGSVGPFEDEKPPAPSEPERTGTS
jgi:hypothetical protein